jgi:glycosyltransferase involved in cell wall biosynthesis
MRKLQILHTVEFYHPRVGGAETVVQRVSEGLIARGHRVTLATSKVPERQCRSLNGVEIFEFDIAGNFAKGMYGRDISRYMQFLESYPIDIMMNYAAQQWASDIAYRQILNGKIRGASILAACGYSAMHDHRTVGVSEYAKYYSVILPTVLPHYDGVIYHSSSYKDYLFGQLLRLNNGFVIPNSVDEEEFSLGSSAYFRQKYGISTSRMILCVANYLKNKGHDKVIRAFSQLKDPDATLVFIGNQSETLDALRQQASGLKVNFLTGVSRADTVQAFKSADLFMFGSSTEAFPLVILEAMASKLPFVSTECGNIKELKGGIVCSEEQLPAQAKEILDNPALREKLGHDGWQQWQNKYTFKAVVEQYENLYYRLAERKWSKHSSSMSVERV